MRSRLVGKRLLGFFTVLCAVAAFARAQSEDTQSQPRGLVMSGQGAFHGYTIVAPIRSTSTYLVDMKGEVVHEWKSRFTPTFGLHLLENGNLLRAARDPNNLQFNVGGYGGIIQEIAWDSSIVWQYRYSSRNHVQHHDIELLPNGNIIILAWERRSAREAVVAGRDPQMITGLGLWTEHLVEIRPTPPEGGEVVWEWHLWNHLIQDRDPKLMNYGSLAQHPELVDINGDLGHRRESDEELEQLKALGYIADSPEADDPRRRNDRQKADWNHANSVSYNPVLDLIALSVLRFGEIWIIDHSTSSEEAAGHSGGRRGRGGDLLYRWGNPQTYRGSELSGQQRLFSQHDARWIAESFPGAGNLTVYNNGRGRPDGEYSSVDEIRLPRIRTHGEGSGTYRHSDPAELVWSYAGTPKDRFYSSHIAGSERLPNGNTLVCVGEIGRVFEVTPDDKIVWDYHSPFSGEVPESLFPWMPVVREAFRQEEHQYSLARALRVAASHPGLAQLASAAVK